MHRIHSNAFPHTTLAMEGFLPLLKVEHGPQQLGVVMRTNPMLMDKTAKGDAIEHFRGGLFGQRQDPLSHALIRPEPAIQRNSKTGLSTIDGFGRQEGSRHILHDGFSGPSPQLVGSR